MRNIHESTSRPVPFTGAAYLRFKQERRESGKRLARIAALFILTMVCLSGFLRAVTRTTIAPLAPGTPAVPPAHARRMGVS